MAWLVIGIVVLLAAILLTQGAIMAKLSDVNDSIAAQTQAITELAARIPVPGPPPAATEADLDAVKAGIDANTATIKGLAPVV